MPPDKSAFTLTTDEADELEAFQVAIHGQRIRVQAGANLPRSTLDSGMTNLAGTHHLNAWVEHGGRPTIFFRVPDSVEVRGLLDGEFMLAPYGWETDFGGALTLSLLCKPYGWLGRACVQSSEILEQLAQGLVDCVVLRKNVPVACIAIDYASDATCKRAFEDNLRRAREKRPVLADADATFWEVTRAMKDVVKANLRPTDYLSFGWVEVYRERLSALAGC